MKLFIKSFIFCGFIALSIQGIASKCHCECAKCRMGQSNDFTLNPIATEKPLDQVGDSNCHICEHRKEMLRLEKERQKQLQKCPFEILGAPSLTGKTSEEIFDEFRDLIVPSQNGFFDLMRGIVRTMHVSSESELIWARAKEAKMMAEKLSSQTHE